MVTCRVNSCIQPFLHPALLRERKRRRAEFLMKTPTSALAEYQMISGHHEVRQCYRGQKKRRGYEKKIFKHPRLILESYTRIKKKSRGFLQKGRYRPAPAKTTRTLARAKE